MRFRSGQVGGFTVHAVTGTNTVSFAITATAAARKGLLGFAVEREDPKEDERYFLSGFKVFESVLPNPTPETSVSTRDHPIQSLVTDDFTAKPGREYRYWFHPLRGKPRNLDRSGKPIPIIVSTEPIFGAGTTHEVFFNRGVASSQAYTRRFGNKAPDDLPPAKRAEAQRWLTRDLEPAMLRFIEQAKPGDALLGCFYEFRYQPVAAALRAALDRGVEIRLILDCKLNDPDPAKAFPRADTLNLLAEFDFPSRAVIRREANRNDIQHNKFMVLLRGAQRRPSAVWTGSTNISKGGLLGQTNVGHWVRDAGVAAQFRKYWDLLSSDPGGADGDDPSESRRKRAALREAVEAITPTPESWGDFPQGTTAVFSPRPGLGMLEQYAAMLDDAEELSCITLAFGINKLFKEAIRDNPRDDHLAFFLLEREDKAAEGKEDEFVTIDSRNNAYKAHGSFLSEPLHRWARETTAKHLGLNRHVSFIHSKFLLQDPLGEDPIVVTGSANFSDAATRSNDENMLVIRGDTRVADIYFTEFNRLFFHYYFRTVREKLKTRPRDGFSAFLEETDAWLKKYAPGTLRTKRVQVLANMRGAANG
jgi:phosphatidylserine/phosphatidylglycerophosphate/cardiolipin synthase-like enzyme